MRVIRVRVRVKIRVMVRVTTEKGCNPHHVYADRET